MNYVYGEEVIIVNFIGDFMILATVLFTRNKPFSIFRCAAGAVIGVLYAFGAILWGSITINLPMKLLVSCAMALIITKPCTFKDTIINAAVIIFTSFVSAGCTLFFSFVFTSSLYVGGGFLFSSNYALLFFGMLAGCLSVKQIYGVMNKYLQFDRLIYPCTVVYNNKIKTINLLADSGNLLRTVTGKNVVVLDHQIFSDLTGISKMRFESYEEYEEYFRQLNEFDRFKVGIILAQTIHSTQYLLVIKIDEIRFKNGFILYDIYTASGNIDHTKGEFGGIFNPILLKRRFDYEVHKIAH